MTVNLNHYPGALPIAARINANVLTYQYDNSRAGANLNETSLTPRNVNATLFGKRFSHRVDGEIYAQPLYLSHVLIRDKGIHNVVYVATEHDSVYAFDADDDDGTNAAPLWHVSFADTARDVIAVPSGDYMRCPAITPEIGITATPVIDPVTGNIYLVAMTKEPAGGIVSYVHRLHALNVATGEERPDSPVTIEAAVAGTGDGGSKVIFNAKNQKERAGLLLLNGIVYTAWSSQCERLEPFHGWLLGYDATSLRQVAVFNSTTDGAEGSFWMSGAAPAADDQGNIFLVSGNGTFDYASGGRDLGQSFIKLSMLGGVSVKDYFTPFNVARLNRRDMDLGSSGVALLPSGAGNQAHPHLLIGAGKEGRIYLLDRDHLGAHNPDSDGQIVQALVGAVSSVFGKPAYFNGAVYVCGSFDNLKRFQLSEGKLETRLNSKSNVQFDYPGCVPTISANGTADGVVWLLESSNVLRGYDASNLGEELYNSNQNAARDSLGQYVKFSVPIVANGRVYAGTGDSLVVYGLLPHNTH